jgi:hypothetical protein
MTSTVRRTRLTVTAAAAAALLLAGCSSEEDTGSESADSGEATSESPTQDPDASPTEDSQDDQDGQDDQDDQDDQASGGGGGGGGGGNAGLPPRPGPDQCVDISVPRNGEYTVYDAGTAVVRREGNRLVPGQVRAANGWTAEITDRDNDEVEIEFRRGFRELDLEVELVDGRVKAEICNDDD